MKRTHSDEEDNKGPAKRQQANDIGSHHPAAVSFDIILSETGLFRQVAHFLNGKDAVALGAVNKDCRSAFLEIRDAVLLPLLNTMESLCKSNVHTICGQVYAPASQRVCTCTAETVGYSYIHSHHPLAENQALAQVDPRYDEAYDSLPIHGRCGKMVHFLTEIVANLRRPLNFTDVANPCNMPNAIGAVQCWSLGIGHRGNAILRLYPRRAALALNLALTKYCQDALKKARSYFFVEDALLGRGGIKVWRETICKIVEDMLPLKNTDFTRFLRESILPSNDEVALLGPSLASRVILCAPFLEWIVGDREIFLPEGLEPFDDNEVQRAVDFLMTMVNGLEED